MSVDISEKKSVKPNSIVLTIVIPVMNEEESVGTLAEEVDAVAAQVDGVWECLWVNDGSTDGTREILAGLDGKSICHRVVDLKVNRGQSYALLAGFLHARGGVLATLDGDGQNDPRDLLRMLNHLKGAGVDMVNGIRAKRNDSAIRRFSSRAANGFRNWLTGESVTDVGCAIRVSAVSVC